jgi:hypothetical protein
MSHFPVDHSLRPAYRLSAAAAGSYVMAVGVIGVIETAGTAMFAQTSLHWALGIRTNRAFAILSIIAGAVIIIATIIGRNVDVKVNIIGGGGFLVVGTLLIALLQTDANVLGWSMANCIASYLIGTVLLAAGMYGKTETTPRLVTAPAAVQLTT